MKKIKLILAAFFGLLILANYAAAQSNQVVIYTDANFRGASQTLPRSWSGGGRFDRNVKSIRVPKGYKVTLYGDIDYGGAETVLTEDWNPGAGAFWTTRVRSIRIQPPTATQLPDFSPVPTETQTTRVTIYTDANYRGASQELTTNWSGGGSFDRRIKSIRVPKGARVTLYGDTNYGGAETTLTEDWNPGDGAYWTTRVRSIRIETGTATQLPGGTATQLPGNQGGTATQLPGNMGGRAANLPDFTPVPTTNYPVLYAGTNFEGASETIERNKANLFNWDGSPHTIRSILVPANYYLVAYTRRNFRGQSYNISSDITFAPGDRWYNRIRSIRVFRRDPAPQPR